MKQASVSLGSDPELFLERNGAVIGSEKSVPKDGLKINPMYDYKPSIVQDGVQLELHPTQGMTPQITTNNLSSIFRKLKTHLAQTPDIKVCMKTVIKVSKEELASLSDDSRMLGCQPSKNYYNLKVPSVDPVKYRNRSAGGHVHFGLNHPIYNSGMGIDLRTRLIPLCDGLMGTISLLLDPDPDQVERRKLYGQAGEYRLPDYGLEYRTLSNFWLRSVPLHQLVMGLAQQCVNILATTLNSNQKEDLELEFLESLDFKKVVRSIQKSDYNLARGNWEKLKPFIMKYFATDGTAPIHAGNIEKFEVFLKNVHEKGLDSYFPQEGAKVIENWVSKPTWTGKEWLEFLEGVK